MNARVAAVFALMLVAVVGCADQINVRQSGAIGDGHADDTAALQRSLDGGRRTVVIPAGTYKISAALKLDSATTIRADANAVIRLADHAGDGAGLFVVTNRDFKSGNDDITIDGGIWDGNNEHNPRGTKEQIPCYSGVALNFINVRRLALRNLTVRNPDAYAIRACHLSDFVIENVGFDFSVTRPNQDGVHLNGFCERGVIRNLRALSPHATNDDMVALNADDGSPLEYPPQQDMVDGPIRNVTVEHLRADSAFTFVRLLSNKQPIENVTVSDVVGGCRYYAVNMDGWRFGPGGGDTRNVTLRDFTVAKMPDPLGKAATASKRPLIHIQTAVHNFRIENFRRKEVEGMTASTLLVDNDRHNRLRLEGLTPPQATDVIKLAADEVTRTSGRDGEALELNSRVKLTLPTGGFGRLTLDSEK